MSRSRRPLPTSVSPAGVLAALLTPLVLAGLAACQPAPPPAPDAPAAAATADAPAADAARAAAAAVADAAAALRPATTPQAAIRASMQRFAQLRSYHAEMELQGGARGSMTNTIDFVAPDRFRMRMPGLGTQTVIGDTMYMAVDGRSMQVPLPAGTLTQWRDPAQLEQNAATMTVQAQGRDAVEGTPARKYLVHNTRPQPSEVTLWIGEDDLPLQVRVSGRAQGRTTTTTIRYSRFDDPTLKIDPPR